MKTEIVEYFNYLQTKYTDEVKLYDSLNKEDLTQKLPEDLKELYKIVSKVELPFGRIFNLERALQESERLPFKPKWFVFGKDNYFSFWLCSYEKNENGYCFTTWDHESGAEIGGAVDPDVVAFLRELEKEYDENEDGYDDEDEYDDEN